MWEITGWTFATWLKLTALLAALVGACWLTLGAGSGRFWLAATAAVLADLWVARQLTREWAHEASYRWWWAR